MYYKNIHNDIQKAAHNPEKPPPSKNNTTIANQTHTHTPEKNKLKKKSMNTSLEQNLLTAKYFPN